MKDYSVESPATNGQENEYQESKIAHQRSDQYFMGTVPGKRKFPDGFWSDQSLPLNRKISVAELARVQG